MNVIVNLTRQEREMENIKTGNSNIKLLLRYSYIWGNPKRIDKKDYYNNRKVQ